MHGADDTPIGHTDLPNQAQERLELALKGAALASWDWDIATGTVISNPRCAEMRGFRPDEISHHVDAYLACIHPDDVPGFKRALSDCFEGTRPEFECEYRTSTKSGDWIWMLSQGKIFDRDSRQRPLRMAGIALDITARKHTEDMLREAQERLDLALKGADLATWDWNIITGEVIFNPRWAEMRGFKPAEIKPHVDSCFDTIHPDDWPALQRVQNECLEGLRPEFECAYRVSTKSGEWIWVLDRGKVFGRDERGKATRMVGTELDITAQKQAETEDRLLAELGAVLASTVEFEDRLTNLARLLTHDLADVCVVDFIEDDGSFRRARVACRDPAMGWVCDAFMRPPASGERPHAVGPVLEKGQNVLIQKMTPDVIGSWARTDEERAALQKTGFQSAIGTPLMAHGKALGAVSLLSFSRIYGPADLRIAEAIAQRAAFLLDNARLFAAARLAIQARDEMLGVVAHDLRNPLAAIVALAAVLRKNEPMNDIGDEIDRSANRMSRLIQDLIDVTRIEAGHPLGLGLARINSAEIISDVLELQKPLASAASLDLRVDVAPDLPDISADRDRLLQIFDNFIGNAIKFTKPGGQITLGASAHAYEVQFSVADTGSGIASSHLPHVFDRFWQAPETRRRGAGLGLAIVKGIVKSHRGRTWVQSTPGQGSTFFFTIPKAVSQADAKRGVAALGGDAHV